MKMMNYVLLALLALPILAVGQNKKNVKISGQLKNSSENYNKVYIFYTMDNEKHLDSAAISKGKYATEIYVSEPTLVTVAAAYIEPGRRPSIGIAGNNSFRLYAEPGNIKLTSTNDFSNVQVEGSKTHFEYEKINALAQPYQTKLMDLMRKGQDKSITPEEKEANHQQILTLQNELREDVYGKYISENPESPMLFYALQAYAGRDKESLVKVLEMYKKLPAEQQNSNSGMAFYKRIQGQLDITVGSMAPDFAQHTPAGELIALSSTRGKYVLLDFWASWCGPCRQENPHVVSAYNKYKDKGFTVFGVSLDREKDKDRWVKAIDDDGLGQWTNVSDLKYWSNEAALKYGVSAIPQNFLIDPDGKIIAKNLRGEALHEMLKKLLD